MRRGSSSSTGTRVEDGVFDAVSLGVEFGALDRGGDDVDAHGLRAGAGGKERHRAHAAVEVEQDLVLFGRNPLKRHGVEPLRLSRIDLQEGFGTHRKAQPPDRRFDAVRARNVQAVASEHRIAGRRVQVEEDARDAFLHELLRKLPDKDPDFGRLAVHAEREEALRLSESTPSLMTIVRTSPSRCDSFQGERPESESMRAAVSAALAIHSGVCGQKQDSGTGKCEP